MWTRKGNFSKLVVVFMSAWSVCFYLSLHFHCKHVSSGILFNPCRPTGKRYIKHYECHEYMSCMTDYYNIEYIAWTLPLSTDVGVALVGSSVALVKQADEGLLQSPQLYIWVLGYGIVVDMCMSSLRALIGWILPRSVEKVSDWTGLPLWAFLIIGYCAMYELYQNRSDLSPSRRKHIVHFPISF